MRLHRGCWLTALWAGARLGLMRAMRVVRPGDLPVFERVDVAEPVAGIGEVVVGIVAAALNRRDWWIWRRHRRLRR